MVCSCWSMGFSMNKAFFVILKWVIKFPSSVAGQLNCTCVIFLNEFDVHESSWLWNYIDQGLDSPHLILDIYMTSLSEEHGHLCVDTTQRLAHLCLSWAESPSGTPSAEQASLLQGLFWHLNQGSKMGVMNVSMRQRSTCATVTQWQSIFSVIVEATSRARTIG